MNAIYYYFLYNEDFGNAQIVTSIFLGDIGDLIENLTAMVLKADGITRVKYTGDWIVEDYAVEYPSLEELM